MSDEQVEQQIEEQQVEQTAEEVPVEQVVASSTTSSSGAALDPVVLLNEVKELALKGDVDGLKTLLTSKRGDIEGLVNSKKQEIQNIVESKINFYKSIGEEKKVEILSLIQVYKGKSEEFQLKAKDQYDNYFQQLMALVDSIKSILFEKIAEIKQKLGMV